ncbi:hypothetical protein H4Q26_017849 [Puccinia striiformis f. sp. tritici PST-130]|nr:hypothetical protein H4Q26_017849 [Puccinia striiformis f. sp. tritici PST-130]
MPAINPSPPTWTPTSAAHKPSTMSTCRNKFTDIRATCGRRAHRQQIPVNLATFVTPGPISGTGKTRFFSARYFRSRRQNQHKFESGAVSRLLIKMIHCDRCAQFGHGCTTLAGVAICMQCATDGTLCSFRTNIEQLRTARRWSNFTSTQRLQIRNWIQQTINDELVPPAPELPRSAVVEDNPEVDQLGEETETEVTEDEETLRSNSEDDLDLLSDPQDNREIGLYQWKQSCLRVGNAKQVKIYLLLLE